MVDAVTIDKLANRRYICCAQDRFKNGSLWDRSWPELQSSTTGRHGRKMIYRKDMIQSSWVECQWHRTLTEASPVASHNSPCRRGAGISRSTNATMESESTDSRTSSTILTSAISVKWAARYADCRALWAAHYADCRALWAARYTDCRALWAARYADCRALWAAPYADCRALWAARYADCRAQNLGEAAMCDFSRTNASHSTILIQ